MRRSPGQQGWSWALRNPTGWLELTLARRVKGVNKPVGWTTLAIVTRPTAARGRRPMRSAVDTRARILAAATAEFAERGLAGGRVDRIAAAADANKERIYA